MDYNQNIYQFHAVLQRLKKRFGLCQSLGRCHLDVSGQATFCDGPKSIALNLI